LVKGVLEWAVWLVEFATKNGLRLNDASPRNAGYDPVEAKWKVIDAGCYKVANTTCLVESAWANFRDGMYRFKGKHASTRNFTDLFDTVMNKWVATRSVEIYDGDIACMARRQTPDVQAGRPKTVLFAAQGFLAASLAAQELRQGEEAVDHKSAAASEVGSGNRRGPREARWSSRPASAKPQRCLALPAWTLWPLETRRGAH
jgi:hypothetical protein